MIRGVLSKYVSTEAGFTVTVKCEFDQAGNITKLHKKDVTIEDMQISIPEDNNQLLTEIRNSMDAIKQRLGGLDAKL